MSRNDDIPPEAAITAKILSDAEQQAEKLVRNAGLGATAEENKTRREVERIEEEARAGWEAKVEKIRTRETSTARIESRRMLLNAREEAVASILAEIERGLVRLREDRQRYRESLLALAAEAVKAVGGHGVVLKLSDGDRDVADDAFLEEVRSRFHSVARGTDFRVEFAEGDNGGGCAAESPDGRIVFDNTLGRRMERMRPGIRAMIIRELGGDYE